MPKICYVQKTFSAGHWEIIRHANEIIAAYTAQGYDLTLRQLYYQFVALPTESLHPELGSAA